MTDPIHTYIGDDAIAQLTEYAAQLPEQLFTVVADENTYAALGNQVVPALEDAGLNTTLILLHGEEVVADEKYLMQVFLKAPYEPQIFIAVGSGTVTDIARYVSYRTRNRFISVPTAPSVDGFISSGAPLVVGGLKDTYPTHPPIAVFADLNTLMQAPQRLIAAGFGDIIGKLTALADWKLEHLIWGDPFDATVEARVHRALQACIEHVDAIAARTPEGIQCLIEALLESGIGMLDFGNSRPASGAEHHCSHYWEMKLLEDGKPAILHGAKVGYATMLIARQYETLRRMTRSDLINQLEGAEWPTRAEQVAEIEYAYGNLAGEIIHIQEPFLDLTAPAYDEIKQRVVQHWDDIQAILATVPSPPEIRDLLKRVGGPTSWQALGLEEARVYEGLSYGHYLRRRFTIIKLLKILNLQPAA